MENENEFGYGGDDNSNNGYGSNGYGSNGYGKNNAYSNNGYGGSGYSSNYNEAPGYAANPNFYGENASSSLGGSQNPWSSQQIENPFTENVYAVNHFDTAYTESLANSNPQREIRSNHHQVVQLDDDQQLEL